MKANKPVFSAEIEWIPPQAGGRKSPPPGPTYMAPARIGPWTGVSPDEANFTLVAERIDLLDAFRWKAKVWYLVDEAPHSLLHPGVPFEFYEGRKCVCRGILGIAVD